MAGERFLLKHVFQLRSRRQPAAPIVDAVDLVKVCSGCICRILVVAHYSCAIHRIVESSQFFDNMAEEGVDETLIRDVSDHSDDLDVRMLLRNGRLGGFKQLTVHVCDCDLLAALLCERFGNGGAHAGTGGASDDRDTGKHAWGSRPGDERCWQVNGLRGDVTDIYPNLSSDMAVKGSWVGELL